MEVDGGDEEKLRAKREGKGDDDESRESKRARLGDAQFLVRQRRYTDYWVSFREKLRLAEGLEETHRIRREFYAKPPEPVEVDAWCVLSWSEQSKEFTISEFDAISQYPERIDLLYGSGTLVHDSRLYYSGGFHWKDDRPAQVLVRSLHLTELKSGKSEWLPHPDVNTPRSLHAIITVGDYIYVFGKFIGREPKASQWGERLYIGANGNGNGNGWEYLDPPPKFFRQETLTFLPTSYAVYYNCPSFQYTKAEDDTPYTVSAGQNLILFPMIASAQVGPVICVFSCASNNWLPSIKLNLPNRRVDRMLATNIHDRLPVVDGVFIWHHSGSINGYDLINQEFLGPLFVIPADELSQDPREFRRRNDPGMFFVRQGDDTLFLFFQDRPYIHIINCHRFRIQKRNQGQAFALLNEYYTRLSTESMNLFSLLDVHPL